MTMTREGTGQKKSVTVLLSGTVSQYDVLMLDQAASGNAIVYTALKAATDADGQKWAAGVASVAGVSGDRIEMWIEGIVTAACGNIAVGDALAVDATAGTLELYDVANHNAPVFAIARADDSGGYCSVWLLNPLGLK